MRQAERELALQAQRAYERTIKDRQAEKVGAGATPGRALKGRLAAQQRGRPQSPSDLRFSSVSHPHPNRTLPQEPAPIQTT